jgi:integrase
VAYGEQENDGPKGWRSRYRRPDGTLGSKSGFATEKEAVQWGRDQEALIRRNMWIDPRDAETPFGEFAEEWFEAVSPRLEPTTRTKYRSHLDNHLLPQWRAWPMIGIFNGYVEIEKWVFELHEEYAESSIASIFATFSTILNAGVRARIIPANPCYGVRVTKGAFEPDHLIASPVQALRGAMRLYESEMGLTGFTLCLADFYSGGRWGELVGQERHDYDEVNRAICVRYPLKEVNGKVFKGGVDVTAAAPSPRPSVVQVTPRRRKGKQAGRTKTPAGTRWIQLPPSIAVFYETLLDSHSRQFVFTSPEGFPLRRSNFRQRFWRPVWDGVKADDPSADGHIPAILPWFTFHEGRHSHATWMAEDGIPEVARRARLGHRMKGIARVYDHVTSVMQAQLIHALEIRWATSLLALRPDELATIIGWFPHLGAVVAGLRSGGVSTVGSGFAPLILPGTQEARPQDRGPGF